MESAQIARPVLPPGVYTDIPKSDKPTSCFEELSKTIQDFRKRIELVIEEVRVLQTQVLGPIAKTDTPSTNLNGISNNVRDHMGDLERTITSLESTVSRFR